MFRGLTMNLFNYTKDIDDEKLSAEIKSDSDFDDIGFVIVCGENNSVVIEFSEDLTPSQEDKLNSIIDNHIKD